MTILIKIDRSGSDFLKNTVYFYRNGVRLNGYGLETRPKQSKFGSIQLIKCPVCLTQSNSSKSNCSKCRFNAENCNEIVAEGVDNFLENKFLAKKQVYGTFSISDLLSPINHPRYHGTDKPGCLFVKKRKERTYKDKHYLDIYTCLAHNPELECLRSGWEIGWYLGTESKKLSDKLK